MTADDAGPLTPERQEEARLDAEWVDRVVAAATPMSPEMRDKIVALLAGQGRY